MGVTTFTINYKIDVIQQLGPIIINTNNFNTVWTGKKEKIFVEKRKQTNKPADKKQRFISWSSLGITK